MITDKCAVAFKRIWIFIEHIFRAHCTFILLNEKRSCAPIVSEYGDLLNRIWWATKPQKHCQIVNEKHSILETVNLHSRKFPSAFRQLPLFYDNCSEKFVITFYVLQNDESW